MFNLILNSSTSIDPKLYNQNWPTNCSKNGRFNQLCQNRPKTKLTQYCITTIDSKLYFTDWRANCSTNVCQKLFDKWLPKRHLPALCKNCLTYLSMTTGSEGVSFRFPQDFFSQHRLKKRNVALIKIISLFISVEKRGSLVACWKWSKIVRLRTKLSMYSIPKIIVPRSKEYNNWFETKFTPASFNVKYT